MYQQEVFNAIPYLLRFPKGYQAGQRCPVILFMHGAGTRGEDMAVLEGNSFFAVTEGYEDFPFITAAPLCSADTWFDIFERINDWACYIAAQPYADPARIYLVGNSMGGYAAWQMAMSNPTLYAAIVPICGGGMYWNAERLVHVPIWAFHGDSDPVVHPRESRLMVEAVNAAGGSARLTVYENCGHDAWTATYQNAEVFCWLLSHERKETAAATTALEGSENYG